MGLTETQLYRRLTASFTFYPPQQGEDSYCVRLREVQLTIGYADTNIYIAQEYPQRSCPYQRIFQHEMGHVAILHQMRARFLPKIRRSMAWLVGRIPVAKTRFPQTAQKNISRRLNGGAGIILKKLQKSLSAAHAIHDSPKNYAKIQAQCKNW